MNIFRQGRLVDSQPGTGNNLVLEIFGNDVSKLIHDGSILGTRFMQLKHGMQAYGWGSHDKVHLYLKEQDTDETDKHIDLQLDHGGDITFTFWKRKFETEPPSMEEALTFPQIDQVVSSDPNDHLRKVGVDSLTIAGAWILGKELNEPGWLEW